MWVLNRHPGRRRARWNVDVPAAPFSGNTELSRPVRPIAKTVSQPPRVTAQWRGLEHLWFSENPSTGAQTRYVLYIRLHISAWRSMTFRVMIHLLNLLGNIDAPVVLLPRRDQLALISPLQLPHADCRPGEPHLREE